MLSGFHRARARTFAATALALDSRDMHRPAVNRVMDTVRRRLPSKPLLRAARLIAQCNQERRHVLAVATVTGGECRARASGREPRGRELESDLVRIRFVAANVAARPGVLDDDVLDGATAHVVVAP